MTKAKMNDKAQLGRLKRSAERMIRLHAGRITVEMCDEWCKSVLEATDGDVKAEIEECIACRPGTGGTGANLAVMEMAIDVLGAASA